MRAALIATLLAISAAPVQAAAEPPADLPGAPANEAAPATADSHADGQQPASIGAGLHAPAHESPLVAFALELAATESHAQLKAQYLATTDLRAVTFEMSRNPPPADEDCARTLGASRFAQQYSRLASLHDQLGDFEAAIEANESASACQPRVATYQASIASAHLGLGHIEEARAAIDRARAIDPENETMRDVRARLDFIQERWADATARFRLQALDEEIGPYLREYARCYLWLAQRRAGMRSPELPEEPADLEATQRKQWPTHILETLRGELTEEALVQAIREHGVNDPREWLTEALFYVGELKLAQGDAQSARRYFASIVNLRVLNFVEYGMARAELKKMRDRDAVARAATAATPAR